MARISLEQTFFNDPRFRRFAFLTGTPLFEVEARIIRLWRYCYAQDSDTMRLDFLPFAMEYEGVGADRLQVIAEAALSCAIVDRELSRCLAGALQEHEVRVVGMSERLSAYRTMYKNKAEAGRKRWKKEADGAGAEQVHSKNEQLLSYNSSSNSSSGSNSDFDSGFKEEKTNGSSIDPPPASGGGSTGAFVPEVITEVESEKGLALVGAEMALESPRRGRAIPEVGDENLARLWLDFSISQFRGLKVPTWCKLDAFVEGVAKTRRVVGLTPLQMEAVFDFIKKSDFWSKNALSPSGLLKKSDRNGLRKIDNILMAIKNSEPKVDRMLRTYLEEQSGVREKSLESQEMDRLLAMMKPPTPRTAQ